MNGRGGVAHDDHVHVDGLLANGADTGSLTHSAGDIWESAGNGSAAAQALFGSFVDNGQFLDAIIDDLLILGSRSLPRKHADALEPWDLRGLVPFAEAYLAGFRAERYQVELPDGFEAAKVLLPWFLYRKAMPEPMRDHWKLYYMCRINQKWKSHAIGLATKIGRLLGE